MTYWGVEEVEVDNIMTDFINKSLAKVEYDEQLCTNLYSIHIVLLDFLKTRLRPQEEQVISNKSLCVSLIFLFKQL